MDAMNLIQSGTSAGTSAVVGALAGLVASALGYAASDKSDKKWSSLENARTVGVGIATGLLSGWQEASLLSLSGLWTLLTATLGFDLLAKLAWRKGGVKFGDVVATLLGKRPGA